MTKPRQHGEHKSKPFYREPSFILSVLALLVSILATVLAYSSSQAANFQQQDSQLQQQRDRLTTAIRQIGEFITTGDGSNGAVPSIDTLRPPLDAARTILDSLESTPYRSTPFEKILVARGYKAANEPQMCLDLASRAETAARGEASLTEKVESARAIGSCAFDADRARDGREAYARLLRYLDETPTGYNQVAKSRIRFETHEVWTLSELEVNDCMNAQVQAVAANDTLVQIPRSELQDRERRARTLSNTVASQCQQT